MRQRSVACADAPDRYDLRMGDGLLFCVDAGASKSRARLVDGAGRSRGESRGGPCNPSTDLDRALANFVALWRDCAAAAGLDPGRSGEVVLAIGAAGLYVPPVRARFLAAIPKFARTVAMSDGYAALIGAGGGAPCGLVIAGTGVAGHRLWPDGRSVQRDAWGWIGGDRGSGCWLGIRALRHALAALDGVHPRDGLAERVLESLGGRAHLAESLPGLRPDRLAALAPVVLAAADDGVASAVAIRERAVAHLAALVTTLDLGAGDPLYLAGGLAPVFAPRLAERIGRPVALPGRDAMHGCFLVAAGRAPRETPTDEAA
jgi:glucosamine kinase